MKVLVVGSGGREHVLAWKLAQSPAVSRVYCAPGNAGTARDAVNVDISATAIDSLAAFAQSEGIDLTVVGPEAPLVAGITDAFEAAGLTVFGPSQAAARLEGSKTFAKDIMRRANVPTADFRAFHSAEDAMEFLESRDDQPWVVKADGLAAGKGVFVCHNRAEAEAAVRETMVGRAFGDAGNRIIIEECLQGEEASILAIVDGTTILTLESSQDHKRAHDGDTGPNTGGMGAYSPTPLISDERMTEIVNRVLVPTVHGMRSAGCPFRGVLYAGLMLTSQGPKVLEFNVRFGDPEAQPVLMRLRSDLFTILHAAATGRLAEIDDLDWDPRPAVCVVMASDGYPGPYEKGRVIHGLEDADALENVKVFHAGTAERDGEIVTDGGRVLGVTALGADLAEAKLQAYRAVKCIRWPGAWCRKDISDKARQWE